MNLFLFVQIKIEILQLWIMIFFIKSLFNGLSPYSQSPLVLSNIISNTQINKSSNYNFKDSSILFKY